MITIQAELIHMRIRVTLQESPYKTIAFHVRTPGGNVHSCRKLFNMLNIERRWHVCRKALKTRPKTRGTFLRQQSRVKLCSADSCNVRRALVGTATSATA